jgi:hypothetical protein
MSAVIRRPSQFIWKRLTVERDEHFTMSTHALKMSVISQTNGLNSILMLLLMKRCSPSNSGRQEITDSVIE